ncbi:lamin tail domain-containing protein [Patescibacteria group bacterium]|nr:lamin tail domain-containing protein [Patescibacteria group bacterium]
MKFLKTIGRIILKASFLTLVVSLLAINFTGAEFFDAETALGNQLVTTTLDLGLRSDTADFLPEAILPGETATRSAFSANDGQLPFVYSQETTNLGGNNDLCQALNITVYYKWYDLGGTLHTVWKYSGPLVGFNYNLGGTDPDLINPNSHDYFSNGIYASNEHWFEYKVNLPLNQDPNLGNSTCSFDLLYKAWQIGGSYGTGFYDSEILSNTVNTGSWAKVMGMKFNDENGNAFKDLGETGLEGWKIYGALETERFNVSADCSPVTSQILTQDETYLIRANGTFSAGDLISADAKYSAKAPSTVWTDEVQSYESYGPELLDLQIDGSSPDWGEYNVSHEYWLTVVGANAPLNFNIYDIYCPNNAGSLEVTIFKVEVEDITDVDGNYELDITGIGGEIYVAEEQQAGWIQTLPSQGYYLFTTPTIYENKDFGNKEVEPQPGPTNIVINEVYYDVAGDRGTEDKNEWIELYNLSDSAIPLKNWYLIDKANNIRIIHENTSIPAHGFALLSHDNSTWVLHWPSVPAATTKVNLGQHRAWLNNDGGDWLKLMNPQNQEVDFVAWENGFPGWDKTANDGQSIARHPLGFDTDSPTDWEVLNTPNPGTNPHSHIVVSINQEDNHLLVGFSNATGFDNLKYAVNYTHVFEANPITELIQGEASKPVDEPQLILAPMFFGTCSSEGLVCTPHLEIQDVLINLIYKNGSEIIGQEQINYVWQ